MFWILLQAMLFVVGCFWSKEIFGRLQTDIGEVKEPKRPGERWVVIFFWAITACIMAAMGWFAYGILSGILSVI